jgi:uncharacterized SAM-binding protein YcdF (DUF218 family)
MAVAAAALLASLLTCGSSYVLQKWLGRLAMPPGLLWLGLLGSSVWLWRLGQRAPGWASFALFVLCWLSGNGWVGASLIASLERDYAHAPDPPSEPYDAVVVLGGASNRRPWQEPQLAPGGDRLATAARLYRRGWMQRVVCFGAVVDGVDLSEDAATLVEQLGVPSDAIVTVPGALNTSQEIAALESLVHERGWKRVGLITSAMHLRRAMKLAQRRGLAVHPIASDFRGGMPRTSLENLPPTAPESTRVSYALWELLGAAVGR